MANIEERATLLVDEFLAHHGISGQKWGVKHGPPYPLDRNTSSAIKKSSKISINVRDLSDEDLTKIVNRLNMEKRLKELSAEQKTKGNKVASKVLSKIGDSFLNTATNIVFKSVESAATKKLTQKLNELLETET